MALRLRGRLHHPVELVIRGSHDLAVGRRDRRTVNGPNLEVILCPRGGNATVKRRKAFRGRCSGLGFHRLSGFLRLRDLRRNQDYFLKPRRACDDKSTGDLQFSVTPTRNLNPSRTDCTRTPGQNSLYLNEQSEMDSATIASGMALAKTGFETLRTALGLVKDVQQALPSGEKKEVAGRALDEADKQLRLAEAEIAKALGYSLCRCEFPPTPMLQVGYRFALNHLESNALLIMAQEGRISSPSAFPINECPKCGNNDAGGQQYHRTASPRTTTT